MATVKYHYKRFWDETTGDKLTDTWVASTCYIETDKELHVIRQMQVFENGEIPFAVQGL